MAGSASQPEPGPVTVSLGPTDIEPDRWFAPGPCHDDHGATTIWRVSRRLWLSGPGSSLLALSPAPLPCVVGL